MPQPTAAWDLLERRSRTIGFWSLVIFTASLAIFLWRVAAWPNPYFDETWYVPTARELLNSGHMLHQEHPPLGKLLIALSMLVVGDDALGWRFMSAIFGAVTLVGILLWSYALFGDIVRSLWVVAITFFDQFVYVQSRIATLDIFVMAFGSLGLWLVTLSLKENKSAGRSFIFLDMAGICLGLGSACKNSGVFLLSGIILIALLIGLFKFWNVRFDDPKTGDFFGGHIWRSMTPVRAAVALVLIPAASYFLTYLPQMIHEGSLFEFIHSHRRMLEIWSGDAGSHPYSSNWYAWPALKRPVWYLFRAPGGDSSAWNAQNQASAVVALSNPLIFFAGEMAIGVAAVDWLRKRRFNGMIITVAFWSQYLPWAINPKGLEFSYYYFPALLCTGPALALSLFGRQSAWLPWAFLLCSALVFCFFLPVLAAGIGVTPQGFDWRMWLSTWR